MDEPMTLIERLRNPLYATNPSGGDALLDTKSTLRDMRLAAVLIEARMSLHVKADRYEAALTTIRDTLPLQNDEFSRRVFAVAADAIEPTGPPDAPLAERIADFDAAIDLLGKR